MKISEHISGSSNLKVLNGRRTSIFLTRLDPGTLPDDIVKFAKGSLELDVKCEKLVTKFDTYASFRVDCICKDPAVLYNPDSWPAGVLVRKYYVKRD